MTTFDARDKSLEGRRVRLVHTNDEWTRLRPGAEGTVGFVDSLGTVHVKWDDGSGLGLVPASGDRFVDLGIVTPRCPSHGPLIPAGDGLWRCPGAGQWQRAGRPGRVDCTYTFQGPRLYDCDACELPTPLDGVATVDSVSGDCTACYACRDGLTPGTAAHVTARRAAYGPNVLDPFGGLL